MFANIILSYISWAGLF